MLGHSSIKPTVDLYGKWLPMANEAVVDRLDDTAGSEVVADAVANGPERARPDRHPSVFRGVRRSTGGVSRRRASMS